MSRSIQRAESEGLTKLESGDMWYCRLCERDVQEGQLEPHMDSNGHMRYKNYQEQRMLLEQREDEGAS